MPDPSDDVVVDSRTLVRLVLEVRKLGERLAHLEDVVKESGLNGHAPAIKKLAEMAPLIERRMNDPQLNRLSQMVEQGLPTIERLVELAPDIVAAIQQSKARETFRRTLFGYFRPLRYLANLAVGAAITALIFLLVNALWLHIARLP